MHRQILLQQQFFCMPEFIVVPELDKINTIRQIMPVKRNVGAMGDRDLHHFTPVGIHQYHSCQVKARTLYTDPYYFMGGIGIYLEQLAGRRE